MVKNKTKVHDTCVKMSLGPAYKTTCQGDKKEEWQFHAEVSQYVEIIHNFFFTILPHLAPQSYRNYNS